LGERNKGFKIAMNALNAGRIKIAVANSAIAKRAFRLGVQYANQRIQFGEPISNFGAIQHKIAVSATRMYANESAWNRVAHQVDLVLEDMIANGMDPLEAKYRSVAEFAMECAMTKVYGSEMEQYVVDEALQMHGGMGYSAESEIETHYRNIRGNRIYEGTNEINRILTPTTLLRKAMKNEIPLMQETMQAFQDLQSGKLQAVEGNASDLEFQQAYLENCKKVTILVAGQAMQTFQQNIKDEQEILMKLADMLTQVFIFESTLLRTLKHANSDSSEVRNNMMTVLLFETADVLREATREVITASASTDMASMTLKALNKLLQLPTHNLKETRRSVANYFKSKNEFSL
jgi:hypothetical protein